MCLLLIANQGNDLGVENLDVLKRQYPCLFFSYQASVLSLLEYTFVVDTTSVYSNKRKNWLFVKFLGKMHWLQLF
jgi:hypothetical protein